MSQASSHHQLNRSVGVFGAVVLGMGSIVGTGVFVSIAIGADVAGPSVVLAINVAAAVAVCNGLSSAQLAATYPVSGGTYEYGHRCLSPTLGFLAGWMFLLAKSASAATAALGFSAYFLHVIGGSDDPWLSIAVAEAAIVLLTVLVLTGLRRSNVMNTIIVSVTVFALAAFVVAGLPRALPNTGEMLSDMFDFKSATTSTDVSPGSKWPPFLEACALMFVAYTGYGRVATLGEEIHNPRRNIPRAVIITLIASLIIYVSVGFVLVANTDDALGDGGWSGSGGAPLELVAASFDVPGVALIVAVGAVTAMLGVLLNLILGLSRVLLAMGRRGDMPASTARLDQKGNTPIVAVIVMGVTIAGIALVGDVKVAWSFSAFAVLMYYALTNLCVLRMPSVNRRYPQWIPFCGLVSCLSLAFFVEMRYWLVGLALLVVGLVWRAVFRRLTPPKTNAPPGV